MAALAKQLQFEEVKSLLKSVCGIELAGDSTPETLPRDLLTAIKTLGALKRKQAADDCDDDALDQREKENGDKPPTQDDVDSMMQFSVADGKVKSGWDRAAKIVNEDRMLNNVDRLLGGKPKPKPTTMGMTLRHGQEVTPEQAKTIVAIMEKRDAGKPLNREEQAVLNCASATPFDRSGIREMTAQQAASVVDEQATLAGCTYLKRPGVPSKPAMG